MDTEPGFGLKEVLAHIVGDIAEALCERAGESRQRQDDRRQAAARTIMTFRPRDAVEAMLAGHCVMFHEMIVDRVRGTLSGEEGATRRATRSGIAAMDRAFGNNLARLERYKTLRGQDTVDPQPADGPTETEIADRVRRHKSRTEPPTQAASRPVASEDVTISLVPSQEMNIAAPEAMPASRAADLARFVWATGTGQPSESELTAIQTAGLNRQARRAIGRQARKRLASAAPGPGTARATGSGVNPAHNGSAAIISATGAD